MKKTILTLVGANLVISLCLIGSAQAATISSNTALVTTAKNTATSAKTITTTTKTITSATKKKIVTASKPIKVTWTNAALRLVNRIPRGVRPAYKKKVENYARRNNIKTITPKVVNDMRE